MWDELVLILGSYLLGSLPFMYIMGRLKGVDLREHEDMHIALWRNVGRMQGLLGVFFDFAKGAIVVVAARSAGFEPGWVAFAGVAAVAGQMWPVFMKFDGEKGNSIGLAMSATLATKASLIAMVVMATGLLIRTIPRLRQPNQSASERLKFGGPPSNSLPVGMAVGFAVLPLAAWVMGQPWEVIVAFVGLFVLIMVRRATAGISEDLRQPSGKRSMLLNRLLYDRREL
ncbi:MAG: glycerol-3-phosphate acyltransferase [Dehalococcoidia bacterium]|nr:glycerol-3-phosphate acyltransferase [Dehalococcoidia bacterium]